MTVSIDAEMKPTKTSQSLWKYNGTVVIGLTGNGGGGIAGLIAGAIVTAINTAAADYTKYARQANGRFIGTVPVGPYHPLYLKDQQIQIQQQVEEKE